ncbi:MAG: Rrf2 family transcriptional regulator [Candidatus Lokiarchaeota archaeon]|nr:Rrf2 family transcriptional regulator [Candidatus Lokiarchaeota archaeon]
MKIFSDKINYGILALFELGKNYHKSHIQIKEISKEQNIPKSYLEQLLVLLKKSELVESIRGAQGGYKLKRPPNQIQIIDIIEALESPLLMVDYSKNSEVLQIYWKKKEIEFKSLFNTTIEELINEENILKKRIFYDI